MGLFAPSRTAARAIEPINVSGLDLNRYDQAGLRRFKEGDRIAIEMQDGRGLTLTVAGPVTKVEIEGTGRKERHIVFALLPGLRTMAESASRRSRVSLRLVNPKWSPRPGGQPVRKGVSEIAVGHFVLVTNAWPDGCVNEVQGVVTRVDTRGYSVGESFSSWDEYSRIDRRIRRTVLWLPDLDEKPSGGRR